MINKMKFLDAVRSAMTRDGFNWTPVSNSTFNFCAEFDSADYMGLDVHETQQNITLPIANFFQGLPEEVKGTEGDVVVDSEGLLLTLTKKGKLSVTQSA